MANLVRGSFDFKDTNGVIRIKGGVNRIYVLRNRSAIPQLQLGVKDVAVCACKTIYAWTGVEPDCPGCGRREIRQLFSRQDNAIGFEDGVYVDVSVRGAKMILGFVIVENHQAQSLSCLSASRNTNEGEAEAIRIARKLWPDKEVFCDHWESAASTGVTYVPRAENHLAHYAARHKIGFQADSAFMCLTSEE